MAQEQFGNNEDLMGEGIEIVDSGAPAPEEKIDPEVAAAEADVYQIQTGIDDSELNTIEVVKDDIQEDKAA